MKKILVPVMFLLFVFASCDNDKNVEVAGVMLMSEIQTQAGLTTELTAIVIPHNATNKDLIWTSTNSEVIAISGNMATAGELGSNRTSDTAYVTVTTVDGGYTDVSRFVVFQSFKYNCNELTSGNNFFGGNMSATDTTPGNLGLPILNSHTLWRIDDLVWSDVFYGCERGTRQGNFTGVTQAGGGSYNADCRINRANPNGSLYSWCAVMRFGDSLFCGRIRTSLGTGWRIPTAEDFAALDRYLRGAGTGQDSYVDRSLVEKYRTEWGTVFFQGMVTTGSSATTAAGITGVGRFSTYWSQTEHNTSGAYAFYIGNDGLIQPNHTGLKSSGRSVRCVRERRADEY